jgi:hypothetical protein
MWELSITEEEGTITLHKIHLIKDNYEVVKEVSQVISKKEADKYMEKNRQYLVERYTE